jgi:cytoskeletal protein RodZ
MHVCGKKFRRSGDSGSPSPSFVTRQISRLLVALMVLPLGGTVDAFSQQAPATPPATAPAPQSAQPQTTEVASSSLLPADPAAETTPDAPQPQNAPAQQQANPPQQQQPAPQQPLGTAAAPYEQPNGITASRPAGAAIAPAKQRRTRTLFIRVGVLVAAAVAVGTVVALSSASPSTPH